MSIISIIIKDVKTILSDKKALAIILLMPVLLMVILSFALKGAFTGTDYGNGRKANIAVVKQYDENSDLIRFDDALLNGLFARNIGDETIEELKKYGGETDIEKIFFEDFLNSEDVKKIITYTVEEEAKAFDMLNKGEVSAVLVLPQGFLYDMKINLLTPFRNKIDIKIIKNPDRNIDGQIVQAVVEAYSNIMSFTIIGKNVLIEKALAYNLGNDGFKGIKVVTEGMGKAMEGIEISLDDVAVQGRKPIESYGYYAAAMLTMFILFASGHGGRMLLKEKEDTTYQRMIVAGTSKFAILAGKFFTIFFIALLQMVIMIAFSNFALKVQWGNAFAVIIISICAAFAVAGLGTLIAAATYRAGNYKMADIFETAIIQAMALLGGSFFPVDIMPRALQNLSFLSLNGTALKAYLKIMAGYGMTDIISYISILLTAGAVFILLGVVALKDKGGIAGA
ncbi:ABC-2 family transporter protein [Oxobacter pfennigii]|uniref:ABC-2 family transporter protein n=1 Tax=Oxobacter pfennigii TaxID=36849 RepID=A0A0P8WNX5_9CLOT|nr:ABC transporter permease [Oxobacter pfennigii]KPU44259.1 ABC-2 family transporter protein [Oxobacter pfennigii]